MKHNYSELPHPGIRSLTPYIPGKSASELTKESGIQDVLKLASNENVLGCSPLVQEALAHINPLTIATYPMSNQHPLREKLANKYDIEPSMITLSNGSDSLFCLLLTCFALHTNKHIVTHDFAFNSYEIQAKTLGIPVIKTPVNSNYEPDIEAMIRACTSKTALIFIANPNNPTGLFISPEKIERLLQHIPTSTLLVLDEAYYEYVEEAHSSHATHWLKTHPNLVITRTFSKAYGLAGLRLGYAISHAEISVLLYRIQLPFAVNIVAMTAAQAALDDRSFLSKTIEMTTSGLNQLKQGLKHLGLNCLSTHGNFVTFDCKNDATSVYQALQQHGIIVRPLHAYGLNQYLRVTVGTEAQNKRFLDQLTLIIRAYST